MASQMRRQFWFWPAGEGKVAQDEVLWVSDVRKNKVGGGNCLENMSFHLRRVILNAETQAFNFSAWEENQAVISRPACATQHNSV